MNAVTNNKIQFEGPFTEGTIASLLNKVDAWPATLFKNKADVKFAVIELCSNVISHHSSTDIGSISILIENNVCLLEVSSYASSNDYDIVLSIVKELKAVPDLKQYYYAKLGNASATSSVNLGLLKAYRSCNGNFEVDGKLVASKVFLTFKLTINDSY